MLEVHLFGRSHGCSLCEGWKRKLTAAGIKFIFHDILTRDGMADMAFHNLARVPSLVIGDQRFEEIMPADMKTDDLIALVNEGKVRI